MQLNLSLEGRRKEKKFPEELAGVTNLLQDPILLGFSFVEGNLSRMLRFGAAKRCTTIDLSQQ